MSASPPIGSNDDGDAPYGGSVVEYQLELRRRHAHPDLAGRAHPPVPQLSPAAAPFPPASGSSSTTTTAASLADRPPTVTVANRPPTTPVDHGRQRHPTDLGESPMTVISPAACPIPTSAPPPTRAHLRVGLRRRRHVVDESNPQHTYTTGGLFTAELTVTDTGGARLVLEPDHRRPEHLAGGVLHDESRPRARRRQPLPAGWITNNSADPDGDPMTADWTFQNGTPGSATGTSRRRLGSGIRRRSPSPTTSAAATRSSRPPTPSD